MHAISFYKDFDGVTNAPAPAFAAIETHTVSIANHRYIKDNSELTIAPEVMHSLQAMRNDYNTEIVFLTTWNHDNAITLAMEQTGYLPHARVIPADLNHEAQDKAEWTQWKADAIIADQKNDPKPFVWVDDNAPAYWSEYVTLNVTTPHLIVQTDSTTGLTQADLAKIEEFLQAHA